MRRIIHLLCCKLIVFFWCSAAWGQDKAIDSLVIVLSTAKQDSNRVILFNKLTAKYISINNTAKAMLYADSSEMLASSLNYKTGKANAIVLKGQAESKKGNWENAVSKYKQAANIYRELGDKTAEANTYTDIAVELTQKDSYVEALRFRNMALGLYEKLNNKDGLMTTYLGIGTVYGYMANYPEALKNILIALKMAREAGRKNTEAGALRNLSVIYQYEKKLDASLNAVTESLKIFEDIGNKTGVASAFSSLGVIYAQQAKYEEAINTFTEAGKIYQDLGDKQNTAYMYNQMGVVMSMQNKFDEALSLYRYALQLRVAINDRWGVAESEGYIGSLLYKQAGLLPDKDAKIKYDSAIIYLSKAALVMKEIGYKQSEQGIYRRLSDIYAALKDYKKALEYKEMQLNIRDSIMNNETTRKLEQQRTQYEVEKALSEEKINTERKMSDERLANEKRLADEKTQHELHAAQEKYLFDLALADERTEQEKIKAEEQLKKEQALAEEKYKSGQVLAATKAEQEKEKAAIKSRNELLMIGTGGLMFGLLFVFLYLRQRSLKQRAIERADSVHKMAELELQSLRAQLNPHFMFNSLNAIQELILMEDNERSHTYLSRFSKLIRMLLENASQPFVPLRKEIEFLELYLSLEKLRIPDLQYTVEIEPGIDTSHTAVPNMMLQPYIENAIWHGLSPKQSDKKLVLRVRRQNGSVQYEIEDNGIGRQKAAELKSLYRKEHKSRGMELLTKRFKLLSEEFGSEIKTAITDLRENENAEGTRVTISVPGVLSGYKKEAFA